MVDEKSILAGLQGRDGGIRASFYKDNRDPLYALCASILGSGAAAADITNDLLEGTIRQPPSKMPNDGLMAHIRHLAIIASIKRVASLQQKNHQLAEEIETVKLPEKPGSQAGDPVGRMRRKITKEQKTHLSAAAQEILSQLDGEEAKTLGQVARETQRPFGEVLEIITPAREDLKARVEHVAGGVAW